MMATSYLNLDVNDDLKNLAVEFGMMNHFAKPLIPYVRSSDEQAEAKDIENNLLQIYLHALKAQQILDTVANKLESFQREL